MKYIHYPLKKITSDNMQHPWDLETLSLRGRVTWIGVVDVFDLIDNTCSSGPNSVVGIPQSSINLNLQ
jgi:hypothetical protein